MMPCETPRNESGTMKWLIVCYLVGGYSRFWDWQLKGPPRAKVGKWTGQQQRWTLSEHCQGSLEQIAKPPDAQMGREACVLCVTYKPGIFMTF